MDAECRQYQEWRRDYSIFQKPEITGIDEDMKEEIVYLIFYWEAAV